MRTSEYFNAMMEANYCEQIIDEACNADYGFNNHFRRVLTVGDCIEAQRQAEVWNKYAQMV